MAGTSAYSCSHTGGLLLLVGKRQPLCPEPSSPAPPSRRTREAPRQPGALEALGWGQKRRFLRASLPATAASRRDRSRKSSSGSGRPRPSMAVAGLRPLRRLLRGWPKAAALLPPWPPRATRTLPPARTHAPSRTRSEGRGGGAQGRGCCSQAGGGIPAGGRKEGLRASNGSPAGVCLVWFPWV